MRQSTPDISPVVFAGRKIKKAALEDGWKGYSYKMDYIADDLEKHIVWYDKKANIAQRRYKAMKFIELFFTCCIPLLNFLLTDNWWARFSSITIGVILAILIGAHKILNYQELWYSYRQTCEALKHEKILALNHAGSYRGIDNVVPELVDRCEKIMQKENASWAETKSQEASND